MRERLTRRQRKGMTLLELMVALTITGFIISAGYAALASMIDRREQAELVSTSVLRAAAIHRTLADWIAGAHLSPSGDAPFEGVTEFVDIDTSRRKYPVRTTDTTKTSDVLTFVTSASTPLGADETMIRLYVNHNDSIPERGLIAELSEWRGLATRRWVLLPNVTRMRMRYLTGSIHEVPLGVRELSGAGRVRSSWLDSYISNSILPAAVELRLEVSPPDTLPPLLARHMVFSIRAGS